MMDRTKLHQGAGALTVAAVVALHSGAISAQSGTKHVTFSKDVAPIFQAKCQSCHEPNSIAPMPLITYQDARPWARSIKERVSARQMPPWHVDRNVGVQKFKNDMSLTDQQVDTIVAWVDQGAPQGNPADMPPPKPVKTELYWQAEADGYGPPDITVQSGEQTMPAMHQDEWWRPVADVPGLTEPRWVRMVEIRPSNIQGRKILHHSIAYLILNNDPDAVNQGTVSAITTSARSSRPRRPQRADSTCRPSSGSIQEDRHSRARRLLPRPQPPARHCWARRWRWTSGPTMTRCIRAARARR
jgi:hypothetical protein